MRGIDVTRPIVQKAIVVVASKPIFGPIRYSFYRRIILSKFLSRDKLGVVTRAYFAQRDFSDTTILSDFHSSLETDLRTKLTESAFYMGTFGFPSDIITFDMLNQVPTCMPFLFVRIIK